MGKITIDFDKDKGKMTLKHEDVTPIEAFQLLLGACQQIAGMFKANEEKSDIIKPTPLAMSKIKNLSMN